MSKRDTGLPGTRKSKSRKTKKRLAIKHAMLAERASKRRK